MPNSAVAYYQTPPSTVLDRTSLSVRKTQLEAFAQEHGLRIVESFSGPAHGDDFEQAVSLSRELGGLLLVTNDGSDEADVPLMVNLTRAGVRFIAVSLNKAVHAPPRPTTLH